MAWCIGAFLLVLMLCLSVDQPTIAAPRDPPYKLGPGVSLVPRVPQLTDSDPVQFTSFLLNGPVLITRAFKPGIRLWDMEAGRVVKTITAGGPVGRNFAVSPDGHLLAAPVLAAPAGDGTIKIWDIGTGDIVRTFEKQAPSTLRQNLAAIGQRDVLRIFDSSDVEKWGYATLI